MVAQTLVLCSAGLDSAVLVALEARTSEVTPAYIAVGLAWEAAERAALDALTRTQLFGGRVRAPVVLSFDMQDVYPSSHWAIRGIPPGYDTPDEDVYIDGRNIALLAKGAIYAARLGIERVALGPLAGNPFPDATPAFFTAMAKALSLGLDRSIEIATPLVTKRKAEVIKLGLELGVPLAQTLSCMNPADGGRHCGGCSKCRDRHDATDYVIRRP
jgi:7-cyano-7-deazaguanine synthase